MSAFDRRFALAGMREWLAASPLLRQLFQEWQLPGPTAPRTRLGLRLAVRNGYLNFYAKGQSVAKLSGCKGLPRLEVHQAYVHGGKSEGYQVFDWQQIQKLSPDLLSQWVIRALAHAGEEKRFVDDLVTANSGTLDMEMGLPGDPRVTKRIRDKDKQVAPRMDLVIAHVNGSAIPAICFWEAKCADNGELRAKQTREPHIVGQLTSYVRWLALPEEYHEIHGVVPDRGAEVLRAYQRAAAVLLLLAGSAGKADCEAARIWQAIVTRGVRAIRQPGIVIGNYWPDRPDTTVKSLRSSVLERCADTFKRHRHLERLVCQAVDPDDSSRLQVQEYDEAPRQPLPMLEGFIIDRSAAAA